MKLQKYSTCKGLSNSILGLIFYKSGQVILIICKHSDKINSITEFSKISTLKIMESRNGLIHNSQFRI